MNTKSEQFGAGHNSYRTAGEISGLIQLVDTFFDLMDALPEAEAARSMYPADLTESRKKLAYFLSGWLGGPRIYAEHYGEINIPAAHRHLNVRKKNSDAWILCMQKAVEKQDYSESFKAYLIKQLRIPANKIVSVCST